MSSSLNVLALDTSTEACVAALQCGEEVRERFEVAPRQHNRLLLPMVTELLEEAALAPGDLDLVAFGCGPGSFTGIRIATGVVQGLAFGLDLPVAPVSTLASLAQGRHARTGDECIAVAMHARQEEIYWGCYEIREGLASACSPDALIQCSEARLPAGGQWVGVGDGWRHRDLLEQAIARPLADVEVSVHPRGIDLIALGLAVYERGGSVAATKASPVYLREKVAEKGAGGGARGDGGH